MGEGEELDEVGDPFAGVGMLKNPRDLVPLDLAGTVGAPYSVWPVCGLVRMTAWPSSCGRRRPGAGMRPPGPTVKAGGVDVSKERWNWSVTVRDHPGPGRLEWVGQVD